MRSPPGSLCASEHPALSSDRSPSVVVVNAMVLLLLTGLHFCTAAQGIIKWFCKSGWSVCEIIDSTRDRLKKKKKQLKTEVYSLKCIQMSQGKKKHQEILRVVCYTANTAVTSWLRHELSTGSDTSATAEHKRE